MIPEKIKSPLPSFLKTNLFLSKAVLSGRSPFWEKFSLLAKWKKGKKLLKKEEFFSSLPAKISKNFSSPCFNDHY